MQVYPSAHSLSMTADTMRKNFTLYAIGFSVFYVKIV